MGKVVTIIIIIFVVDIFSVYSQLIPLQEILRAKNYQQLDSIIIRNSFIFYKTTTDTFWYNKGKLINYSTQKKYRRFKTAVIFDSIKQIKRTAYYKRIAGDSIIIEYTENISKSKSDKEEVSAHIILKNDKIYFYFKNELIKDGYKLVFQRKARLYRTIIFKKDDKRQILISGLKYSKNSSYSYSFSTPN